MSKLIDLSQGEGNLPSFVFKDSGLAIYQEPDLRETLELIEALTKSKEVKNLHKWFRKGSGLGFKDLPKHNAFFKAGVRYAERYISAANRVGKTISGAYETAVHATGLYPDDWEGRKWDRPVRGWAVGSTKETTRDILQKELIGSVEEPGSGMIPPELILKVVNRPNSGGAIDYVLVKHVSGGSSLLGFKSYEQGIESFYGTALDFVWMDELPPLNIYSEAFTRTMTTNGMIYVTATPLAGLTPFVLSFYNSSDFLPEGSEVPGIVSISREQEEKEILAKMESGELDILDYERYKNKTKTDKSKAVVVAGWDDAPWLEEAAKKRMLEATPAHLRQSRSTGLPSMGSGSVFTIPVEEILVKDFEIPSHWKKVGGLDVGWNNTAASWLAINPDTDEVYLYSDYKRGQVEPPIHAAAFKQRGDWIRLNIDPASRGRSQTDGTRLFQSYIETGLKLVVADNAVEAGIAKMQEMFATGQLKVFKSCLEFQKEYVTYRRSETGKIVKENDHILDSVRYALLGIKHARTKPQPMKRTNLGGGMNGKRYDI